MRQRPRSEASTVPSGAFILLKMLKPIHLKEGIRYFKRARRVKKYGWKKYKGNAEQICRQIIKECWNGTYFQTSAGHFCEFWTRDFAFCAESLIKLGYKKEVEKTVQYALNIFKKNDKITTTISPDGKPFDFPCYAVDSVPCFIRILRITNKELIKKNKDFLNKKIDEFYNKVIDKETGLVRKDKYFSSIKDYAKRTSSCYGNCMVAMLNNKLKKIKILENPFKSYNYKNLIKKYFWRKTHFVDDLSGYDFITGDANVFPFYLGIFNEKNMLKSSIRKIQEKRLDKPFPLRYYHEKIKKHDMISLEIFAKDYERDTVWCHLGPLYIKLIKRINKKKANYYIKQYKEVIEKNKNYLELFFPNKRPYSTFWYYADEGMLWASIILEMLK